MHMAAIHSVTQRVQPVQHMGGHTGSSQARCLPAAGIPNAATIIFKNGPSYIWSILNCLGKDLTSMISAYSHPQPRHALFFNLPNTHIEYPNFISGRKKIYLTLQLFMVDYFITTNYKTGYSKTV